MSRFLRRSLQRAHQAYFALALFALIEASAAPTWAVTVPPDSTSPPLAAVGCFYSSGSLDNVSDLPCPDGVCSTGCDAGANQAKTYFNISNLTAGRRYVESTVYADFTVEAASDGSATKLDGTIAYDAEWAGGWTLAGLLTGFNDVKSTMSIVLWDQTEGGKVVSQAVIHTMDANSAGQLPELPIDIGGSLDHGQTSNTLVAKLVRGHTYRVGLKTRCEGKGALNATIIVDYFEGAWGLKWNELRVAVAPDLEEQIAKLTKRVEKLEHDLQHHTHTYLTGRGEGHNNTVASTSEAVIVDEGTPSDDESKVLPPEKDKKPLPAPSVLVSSAPNPFNPVATITYALPERLPVTMRVYDVRGRLVQTLVDAEEDAGEHRVLFEAGDLPSGSYFYRINAGPYTETRKVTLLK